jgi:hypothetical protein
MSRNNPLLIIHDSGGFEAGETSNLTEIKRFIASCTGQTELEKQLHCIWYGIPASNRTVYQPKLTLFCSGIALNVMIHAFGQKRRLNFSNFSRIARYP